MPLGSNKTWDFEFCASFKQINDKTVISSVTLSTLKAGRTEPHLREAKPPSFGQAGRH